MPIMVAPSLMPSTPADAFSSRVFPKSNVYPVINAACTYGSCSDLTIKGTVKEGDGGGHGPGEALYVPGSEWSSSTAIAWVSRETKLGCRLKPTKDHELLPPLLPVLLATTLISCSV